MKMPSTSIHEQIKSLHNEGRYDGAIQAACQALEASPDDARLWELLGIASHARRLFPETLHALETATLLAPLSPAAQVALAGAYLATGRCELAKVIYAHLVLIIERVPTSLLPNLVAGLVRLDERHLALDVHRERAYRSPTDSDALFAVAQLMRMLGYPPEFILPIARRGFRLAPECVRNRVALALTHFRNGNLSTAHELVVEIDSDQLASGVCPCMLRELAMLFQMTGDHDRRDVCMKRLADVLRRAHGEDSCQEDC